ncbi:MAG: tetratricopeptide repeat protein [Planctomycetota bacterium]
MKKDYPRKNVFAIQGRWTTIAVGLLPMVPAILAMGCNRPTYRDYWIDGQRAMIREDWGPARAFLQECDRRRPRRVDNLYDMGVCSMMIAQEKFEEMNHAAAARELDRAIAFFDSAIDDVPGHQPSLEGKNRALELKGQFSEALRHTEWAVKFVGPSAKQYIFFGRELEERGDMDAALLRYHQAVTMEPTNPEAHIAFAKFLLKADNEPMAIHHLKTAHELNPKDAWVTEQLVSRGVIHRASTRKTAAP